MMCHSHSSLSRAMWSHRSSLPLRMGEVVVVCLPVVLDVLVMFFYICVGSRVCRLLVRAFLFVVRTPDLGRGLSTQGIRRSLGGWWSSALAILPRKVICRAVMSVFALGMSWKIFLILVFLMCSSITSDIFNPRMLRMLLCQNEFSLSMWDWWRAQFSHPHSSRLAGIARKMSCLALRSA